MCEWFPWMYEYVQWMFRVFRDQNGSWDTLEFGLVVVVSQCVLGTKPGSFENVVWASALSHLCSLSSAHCDGVCLRFFSHFTLHCWVSSPPALISPCFQNWTIGSVKSLWLYFFLTEWGPVRCLFIWWQKKKCERNAKFWYFSFLTISFFLNAYFIVT